MQNFTLGAGLASLAFWGFIAAVVVAGIWYDIRKKESQQETIRRLFESGQPIDDKLIDKLVARNENGMERPDRTYLLAGLIVFAAGIGLAIFGLVLGMVYPETKLTLLGVSALVGCIGLGLLAAAKLASRWYKDDNGSGPGSV
jgi:hypothetical protein